MYSENNLSRKTIYHLLWEEEIIGWAIVSFEMIEINNFYDKWRLRQQIVTNIFLVVFWFSRYFVTKQEKFDTIYPRV